MYGNYKSGPAFASPYNGTFASMPPDGERELYDPQMDTGYMKSPFVRGQQQNSNFIYICACLFVPWAIFSGVCSLMSLDIHYRDPDICMIGSVLIGVIVLAQGAFAFMAWRRKGEGVRDHFWYTVCFVLSVIAWVVGFFGGQQIYLYYILPYLEVQSLNAYPSVDPSMYQGQQLMDAGIINFKPGSYLDLQKSMGFRNLDVYCVAPITIGTGNSSSVESYDFWAVGLNCCSGHGTDFHCGEYRNPNALSGLRLMRDDQRPYFRLAVQQAEAAYNIRAVHPIFVHWTQDPRNEINSFQDTGYRYLLLSMFFFFACNLVIVGLIVAVFGM